MAKPIAATVHTLKVTLNGVRPPLWRRLIVPSDTKLSELGAIVEAAMGWEGYHLHAFETPDGVRYGWEHHLVVESIDPVERCITYPRCLAGKRACPPEDCGGPWAYSNLLAALADSRHPDHEDLTEWIGGPFDPEHFDVARATAAVRSPRPPDGW